MSNEIELSTLIGQLNAGRVLCVGDIMLDRFIEGNVSRISPEGPIPVLEVENKRVMLGGVGNVVRNLNSLGACVELVAAVGTDPSGDEIEELLKSEVNANFHLIRIVDRKTSIKTRYLASGQQLLRTDIESCDKLCKADCDKVLEAVEMALGSCNVMIISDYGKGLFTDHLLGSLIQKANEAEIPILVDPKGADYNRYRGATLLTPNRQELAEAAGQHVDEDDAVVSAARLLINACGIGGILATRGEEGATLVNANGIAQLTARHPQKVFDVSGAGDTVIAALAAGIASGATLELASEMANIAGGVVVGKVGTAVALPSEILEVVNEHDFPSTISKVMTLNLAMDRVAAWRRQGYRVGLTNGCFDLLHRGHVALLEQARASCDRLVVAINSDESVRKLKGSERPIQNESSRALILASMAVVDLVVVFSEDTPLELINTLTPDVLVKGADYLPEEVVGAEEVKSWGGTVLLADMVEGSSTQALVEKMKT